MPCTYTLLERGALHRNSDYPGQPTTLTDVFLPDADFDALRLWAMANPNADSLLSYGYFRGHERMVWRGYVGVLRLSTGTYLEIRPRAGQLQNLLRCLPDPAFKQVSAAPLGAVPLPLWSVFAHAFLAETARALVQGPARSYVARQATLPLVRGKIRLADHLRQPLPRPDRLPVIFDEHTTNTPANRILKTALVQLVEHRGTNPARCHPLLQTLGNVPVCTNLAADLLAVQGKSRLNRAYEPALRWATWLLNGQGPGLCLGRHTAHCLLFSMERIFEQYVAAGFRRAGVGVQVQEATAWLVDDHQGVSRFRLRPDLLIRQGNKTVVLDTKWKTLDATDTAGHYGIEQADLYQLYAYGKKYDATDLVLIYPAHSQFSQPLARFGFDAQLRLRVVPFDLDKPLDTEVARLLHTVLGEC